MHLIIKGSILIPLILLELLPSRCWACQWLFVFGAYVQVREISNDESSHPPDSNVPIVSSMILFWGDTWCLLDVNEQTFTNCPVSIHDMILQVISYKLEVSLQCWATNTLDLLSSQNLYGNAATCTAPLNGLALFVSVREQILQLQPYSLLGFLLRLVFPDIHIFEIKILVYSMWVHTYI